MPTPFWVVRSGRRGPERRAVSDTGKQVGLDHKLGEHIGFENTPKSIRPATTRRTDDAIPQLA